MTQPTSHRGFTLLEVLAAMVIAGLLVVILGRVMVQIINTSMALEGRLGASEEVVALRRVLHRDFQNIQDMESLSFSSEGFMMKTSNNLLVDGPLPVTVTWLFEDQQIMRRESLEAMNHEKEIVLVDSIEGWELRLFDVSHKDWNTLENWLLASSVSGKQKTRTRAIELKLQFTEDASIVIVERFPDVLFQQ